MTNRKKKVIYVVPGLNFFNEGYRGRVMHALGVCEGFSENHWDVTIIGGQSLNKFCGDIPESVRYIELDEPKGFVKYLRWWPRLWFEIFRVIKAENPDLIVIRYAALAYLFLGAVALHLPSRIKKVVEVNSFVFHMVPQRPAFVSAIVSIIESFVLNRYSALYLVSEAMMLDKRTQKFKALKIVIPNGASSKNVRCEMSVSDHYSSEARLVYLGTLMHYWDFQFLAKALNDFHDAHKVGVAFYGDGPKKELLLRAINRKDLVEFHGTFNRNDVSAIVDSKTDILLLPPKTKEDMVLTGGLSTKLFDYLAMGLPILAPSDGEIPTVLENEKNSLLYMSRNSDDFCSQAERMISDHSLRKRIASKAYLDFESKYSWAARMRELIRELEKGEVL